MGIGGLIGPKSKPSIVGQARESHRLLEQLGRLMSEDQLSEADKIGGEYGRISLDAGMSLSEAVAAFLFFRSIMMESFSRVSEPSNPGSSSAARAEDFIDRVLIALVETYETAQTV